jgi:hypothetical protein
MAPLYQQQTQTTRFTTQRQPSRGSAAERTQKQMLEKYNATGLPTASNILDYSIDVLEDSIVFLKKRKLDSTPSLVLSKSNGLIDFKYNQRPKKFNVNYMNRKLTYGSSPNGVFTIDYEGESEFPAEQRHMAYIQLINELQNNQEISVTASMGHYIGLENIVFLNVDDSNIAGAHRVVSKSITCNQSSISLNIGLNKALPVLSDYLSQ